SARPIPGKTQRVSLSKAGASFASGGSRGWWMRPSGRGEEGPRGPAAGEQADGRESERAANAINQRNVASGEIRERATRHRADRHERTRHHGVQPDDAAAELARGLTLDNRQHEH